MKRLIFSMMLLIGMVFMFSCQQKPNCLITDDTAEIETLTPAYIIWYKLGKTGWEVNKSWFQEDEMTKIKELLTKADKTMPYTEGEYKLSLVFYDGRPENLKLWEVRFTLVGKRSFLSSVGSSRELGEFLSEYKPEERILIPPGVDPNRIKEAQERLRKHVEQMKAKREAEAQRETEEVNQPE